MLGAPSLGVLICPFGYPPCLQPFQPTLYDIRQGVELEHAA